MFSSKKEEKKKKSRYGYESMIHAQNWTWSSTGVCHYRTLTYVDSHGGKDAVVFL